MTNRCAFHFLDGQRSIMFTQIDVEIEKARVRGDTDSMARLQEIRKTLDNEVGSCLNGITFTDE